MFNVDIVEWMNFNMPGGSLTGTDWKALRAAEAILKLYAYGGSRAVLPAFKAVVEEMQATTRHYAYHAIAMAMDWYTRPLVWEAAGLEPLTNPGRCKAEPFPKQKTLNKE